MFKTETHMHTSESSYCGKLTAAEMVEQYHNAGYKTLFVSDHFYQPHFDKHPELDFDGIVDFFLRGYHAAKEAGEKYGMNILLSAEYLFNTDPGHYLVYGIDEDFLYEFPKVLDMTVPEFHEITKSRGIMLIQAHPFRGLSIPRPTWVDGFEVYNSNPRHVNPDDEPRCEILVKENGLLRTAGSDSHRPEDVAGTGIGSECEIKTAADYIELIKGGKGVILRKE